MANSVLEQYRISDLLEWFEKKRLILNPKFQRRNIWTKNAKVYLIDTILRQLPIPKIYMRTKIDLTTKTSYREIVDGQQRLRAIIEFANDRFSLTKRAKEFNGMSYSTLDKENQEIFLSYSIAVDQLINASDTDVLEVFARLNSYTLPLNAAELRHAKYQGDFKWAIHEESRKWKVLWEEYQIVSVRERLRMLDDSLMAEMFGIILQGVTDGGQIKINKLYDKYDPEFKEYLQVVDSIEKLLSYLVGELGEIITGTIASPPNFLMLFAAVAHALYGIPNGDMEELMPSRDENALSDLSIVKDNLGIINRVLELDEPDQAMQRFWYASKTTTHRISSRRIRFPVFYRALLPTMI